MLRNLLAASDLFVLPSWAEGLPNSVLEAMASGLPIVSTRVGGIPELIEDEVSGLLVPPKNPEALSIAIKRLLGDEIFAKKLAMAAQDRARTKFSFEKLLLELETPVPGWWTSESANQLRENLAFGQFI